MNQMVLSRLHSPTLFLICFIAITLPVRAEDGNGFTESTEVSARQPTQAPANEISKNLVYRSEYEAVNDLVFDLNDPHEGTVSYCMISGNNDNYYAIDSLTGVVTFTKEIPDVVGEVHKDTLFISVAGYNYQKKYQIVVVDGFDFFIETHPEYKILTKNQEELSLHGNPYTPYNNIHGKGKAVLDKDFRMSILVDIYTLPNKTVFIWDTPSEAKSFADGKNIWGYLNIIWGMRSGVREDLPGYPIKVGDVKKLGIDFDFEKLYGTDDYKIALNNFFTKENTLQPLKTNTGDFFFVFDQIGNYIPKYSVTMPDITLGGNLFSVLYTKNQATGRDSRRLIIKDGRQWLKGTLDLLSVYKLFIDNGYIDTNQYIPNIQIGIEVTKGFAGVRVNKWSIQKE